ncbi:MAG: phage major capsid protein [Planctomycetota bacterium]
MSVTGQSISRTDLRVFAFTRDHVLEGNRDHVFSHSPTTAIFLDTTLGDFGGVRLRGAGHRTQTGGHAVMIRVRLGKHAGDKFMAGPFDTHSVSPDENTRLAEANWVHASGALVISEYDKSVNAGEEALASFVADQTESVMLGLADTITDAIHATTITTNGVTPIDDLVHANDSLIQGLTPTDFANYHSRGVSARGTAAASISFASGSFAAQGISDLRTSFNNASEGQVQPNVGITTYANHERYEGALQPLERFQGAVRVADGSFGALAFRTVPVLADPKTASGAWYWLNVGSRGIEMIVLNPHDFRFAPFKPGANQETFVSELQWKGALIIHNRRYGCNKLTSITD